MIMSYEIVKKPTKTLSKAFNLTFDKKFGYCISDAYTNDKGEPHPSYLYHYGNVYTLKYTDGCFHPYLVKFNNTSNFGAILDDKGKVLFVIRYNPKLYKELMELHNNKFKPL